MNNFFRFRHWILLLGNKILIVCCLLVSSDIALSQVSSSYQLGSGDKIKILVYEEPDMSMEVTIDNTGIVTYPYLNEVVIAGKTTSEVEAELVTGLKGRVLINPNIAVSVLEYRPFSIGGEVKNPGNYAYEPNLTVRKAVNLAGGATEWSNGKRFTIERKQPVPKEQLSLDTSVRPGDVITILPRRF